MATTVNIVRGRALNTVKLTGGLQGDAAITHSAIAKLDVSSDHPDLFDALDKIKSGTLAGLTPPVLIDLAAYSADNRNDALAAFSSRHKQNLVEMATQIAMGNAAAGLETQQKAHDGVLEQYQNILREKMAARNRGQGAHR